MLSRGKPSLPAESTARIPPVEFRLLGSLEVVGGAEALPRAQQVRTLLVFLLLHANEPVPASRLADILWPQTPPARAQKIVQVRISDLRKVVRERLRTVSAGYLLSVEPGELDVERARALAVRAAAASATDAAALAREALSLWRGQALSDVLYEPFAQTEIRALDDLRLEIQERCFDAELALGHDAALVGELRTAVAENPHREHLLAQLMLALYRSGAQADALAVHREGVRYLRDELGLDPTPEVQELERRILQHDPTLGQPRQRPSTAMHARHRRRFIAGVGVAIAVAAGVVAAFVPRGGSALQPRADAVAHFTTGGRLDQVIATGSVPQAVVMAYGSLFVSNYGDGTVERIRRDRASHTVVAGGPVSALASGFGAVWALDAADGVLSRLDPATGTVTGGVSVGHAPSALAAGDNGVWLVGESSGAVLRVDPRTLRVTLIPVHLKDPVGVAVGGGSLWISDGSARRIVQVDPRTGRLRKSFAVAFPTSAIAVAGGSVWTTDPGGEEVTALELASGRATYIAVGNHPTALALAGGEVWVVVDRDHRLAEIDATARVVRRDIALTPAQGEHVTGGGVTVLRDGSAWVTTDGL
jgi:DNA-binding SARP family transcriptional activator/streptogramin lyase